jgi:hypothetical protein
LLILAAAAGCRTDKTETEPEVKSFPQGVPQKLTYENVSILVQDMQSFSKALKPLNVQTANKIDERYTGVFFEMEQKPLFLNVYPDPENKRVVFLIAPKDPSTGASPLLRFDKNLPIVNTSTVEIQIRTQSPEEPLTCLLSVNDPDAYIADVQNRLFTVRYKLYKRFLQSGTFDFDALTIPTYRQRGYPFIVFDLADSELVEATTKQSIPCRQM